MTDSLLSYFIFSVLNVYPRSLSSDYFSYSILVSAESDAHSETLNKIYADVMFGLPQNIPFYFNMYPVSSFYYSVS